MHQRPTITLKGLLFARKWTKKNKKGKDSKNICMLDSKSMLVLKILAKESVGGSYKIFESADLISALPKHYRTDSVGIRHILTHLERQDMISIKYDDDDTYCLAVLPYGNETIENEKPSRREKNRTALVAFLCFLFAFLGAILGVIVTYYLLRIG